jgi:hypothetical protein
VRDRLRRQHPDAPAEAVRVPVAPAPDVAAVLRLQALAGNAAVSRMLAREEKAHAPERTIAIEGLGSAPIVAFMTAGAHGFRVTLEDGPLGPKLQQAATRGDPIPSVTITASGHRYTLSEVSVAGFQVGGTPATIVVELQGASLQVE